MPGKKPRRISLTENVPMYELKITLLNTSVWRRILVRGDVNLGLLHAVIQIAVGWTNSHLHQFFIGKKIYTDPTTCDDMIFDEPDLDENEVLLMEIAPREKMKFIYEYDFGDSWEHEIKVARIHVLDTPPKKVAECLDGACACPPEDCGGVGGFWELLEIIKNPTHQEYESMMEWLGVPFDPNAFDLQEVNKYLKKVKFPRMTVSQLAKVLMERDSF